MSEANKNPSIPYRPPDATPMGIVRCSDWLTECLKLGWTVEQLDDLASLFWKYRDRDGKQKEQIK